MAKRNNTERNNNKRKNKERNNERESRREMQRDRNREGERERVVAFYSRNKWNMKCHLKHHLEFDL